MEKKIKRTGAEITREISAVIIIIAAFAFMINHLYLNDERYGIYGECCGLMHVIGPKGEFKHGDSAYFHTGFFEPYISSKKSNCKIIIQ